MAQPAPAAASSQSTAELSEWRWRLEEKKRSLTSLPSALLSQLDAFADKPDQLDLRSIGSVSNHDGDHSGSMLGGPVRIIDLAIGQCSNMITIQGQDFEAHRMPADGSGVEMRSTHTMRYRYTSKEAVAAAQPKLQEAMQKKQAIDAEIAYCKKLLRELPDALANNQSAFTALQQAGVDRGEEVDLSELGAMALEHRRIQNEIAAQRSKLAGLTPLPPPSVHYFIPSSAYQSATQYLSLMLGFGLNRLGIALYHVSRQNALPVPEQRHEPRLPVVQFGDASAGLERLELSL